MIISKEFEKLRNKLIVSCQAENDTPFNSPEALTMFAVAAEIGGAGGIRSEGVEKIKSILSRVNLPLIGLIKNQYPDGLVRITRTFSEVESLLSLNVKIIAIDGTFRKVDGYTGPEFIKLCKKKYKGICILADIAQKNHALECLNSGADGISTALRGYTPETNHEPADLPNFKFIKELCINLPDIPIIAEGKINTPSLAHEVSRMGVWSIVVGSAITRPHIITQWFTKAISKLS